MEYHHFHDEWKGEREDCPHCKTTAPRPTEEWEEQFDNKFGVDHSYEEAGVDGYDIKFLKNTGGHTWTTSNARNEIKSFIRAELAKKDAEIETIKQKLNGK